MKGLLDSEIEKGMRAHRRSKAIPSMEKNSAEAAVSAFIDVYTAVACQPGGRSQPEVAVAVLLSFQLLQLCFATFFLATSTIYLFRDQLPLIVYYYYYFFFSGKRQTLIIPFLCVSLV